MKITIEEIAKEGMILPQTKMTMIFKHKDLEYYNTWYISGHNHNIFMMQDGVADLYTWRTDVIKMIEGIE